MITNALHSDFRALNTLSLREAASAYALAGIPVFPLVPRDKRPLTPRGVYSATTDLDTIETWWKRWPQANIGVATGTPSGLWVLDIDPRHDGMRSLGAIARHVADWETLKAAASLIETLQQQTGGNGVHLVYQMRPLDVSLTNVAGFAGYPGIDLRVSKGYIVAAPSVHPSGRVYQWHNELPPAPFPQVLVELFVEHSQRAFSRASSPMPRPQRWIDARFGAMDRELDPEYWLHCALKHARPGNRHSYACFLACCLVDRVGCSFEDATYWMREYVSLVPQFPGDPYLLEDALSCLAWAWQRPANHLL